MLRKIEEAVGGTNGGRSPKLAPYYAHWERAVFHALNALVLNGMKALTTMLSDCKTDAETQEQPGKPTLFKVTSSNIP